MPSTYDDRPAYAPQDVLQIIVLRNRFIVPAGAGTDAETILPTFEELAAWSARAATLAVFKDSPNVSGIGGDWHLLSLDPEFTAWMDARQETLVLQTGDETSLTGIARQAQAAGLYRCVLLENDRLTTRLGHPVPVALALGPYEAGKIASVLAPFLHLPVTVG